jgi:hypothetical protein
MEFYHLRGYKIFPYVSHPYIFVGSKVVLVVVGGGSGFDININDIILISSMWERTSGGDFGGWGRHIC